MTSDPMPLANMVLRGGACSILGLIAVLLLRDYGRLVVARLGALFAVGSIAFSFRSMPGFDDLPWVWRLPLVVLATGNTFVFWMFARKLFDDGFRPRWRHAVIWAGLLALQLVNQVALLRHWDIASFLRIPLDFQSPVFAILAVLQTALTWREDLIERRRSLRIFVVVSCAGYSFLDVATNLAGNGHGPSDLAGLTSAAGLLAIVLIIACLLLNVSRTDAVSMIRIAQDPPAMIPVLTGADQMILGRLENLMAVERAYRQDGLTVGALATRLGLPEYRLRRLINQGLGHRNFASFVNGYRIGDAKAALSDTQQDEVSILTIALDAGFASLGPFNRAFKAETGMTPTEFRNHGQGADTSRSTISARRISKSA